MYVCVRLSDVIVCRTELQMTTLFLFRLFHVGWYKNTSHIVPRTSHNKKFSIWVTFSSKFPIPSVTLTTYTLQFLTLSWPVVG